jgi:hypothetical protein
MHHNSIKSAPPPPKSSRIHTSMALWARICQRLCGYVTFWQCWSWRVLRATSNENEFRGKFWVQNRSNERIYRIEDVLDYNANKNISISNLRWKLFDFQSLDCISFLSTAEPISSSPSKHLRQVSTVRCRDIREIRMPQKCFHCSFCAFATLVGSRNNFSTKFERLRKTINASFVKMIITQSWRGSTRVLAP